VNKPFTGTELRRVLGAFATGVTVVTTVDRDGRPSGLTVNSFSSVSLDPPLVLWSQSRTAPSHSVFQQADRFAVSILAADQIHVSERFSRKSTDKFEGVRTIAGLGCIPLIDGAAAHVECRSVVRYPGGDHTIFIGEVERIHRSTRQPLLFGIGRYLHADAFDSPHPHMNAIAMARQSAARLSLELGESTGVGVWGNQGPTIIGWWGETLALAMHLRAGFVLPVLASATGQALAAFLPPARTELLLQSEITDIAARGGLSGTVVLHQVQELLAAVRACGLAMVLDSSTFRTSYQTDIDAISAPVLDGDGEALAALTIVAEAGRLQGERGERAGRALRAAADQIRQELKQCCPAAQHAATA